MVQMLAAVLVLTSPTSPSGGNGRLEKPLHDYPVQPVPFTAVHIHDKFWAPRIETNRSITIPYAFEKCEETGRMDNFDQAARRLKGEQFTAKLPGFPFDDTDVYKVLEGAAYALSVKFDPKLDAYLDKVIAKIKAAQEPDGYLYTARTMDPTHPHDWSGKERWVNEQDQSHELYNLGHLYEAAVAHYQATGKRSLLDIATKTADLLVKTFGPGKRKIWPGHQIIEMGLAKLYRVTGKQEYLDLAKFFLDSRGGSGEYWQAHKPPVDQDEAVGHAVRAVYMYSGMADVAALKNDDKYLKAIDRLWANVVDKKLYITGGIGATGAGEAFGRNYELPNLTAYCETCAAIGNDYWNQRLFELHGDGRYVDVLERTLYNGLLSGISLDGTNFFYPNPLASTGQHSRSPWFGCACCPGNITRFLASIPGYMYAVQKKTIYANLFASSDADVKLESGQTVKINQETEYPWNGTVKFTVDPGKAGKFTLNVRIPGWARNEVVPSDLYRYTNDLTKQPTLTVNGKGVALKVEKGYVALDRNWKKGDVVTLNLPMETRRVLANTAVKADQGRVSLERGPIVYCLEWVDNKEGDIRNIFLPDASDLKAEYKADMLGGIVTLTGAAKSAKYDDNDKIVTGDRKIVAIPYYSWANRGRGNMLVWIPNSEASSTPTPRPTLASASKVKTSGGVNPQSINDNITPKSSADPDNTFFHWWPKKGTTEWVEYTLAQTTSISEASLYWFDDTGHGECRAPASWRILYKDGDAWKPVETTDPYGVALNKFNVIKFKPVTTSALRLEVTLQNNWSAGIQEWRIK